MKIMLSAGEASGDLHGEGLAKAIHQLKPEAELIGFGGPKMAEAASAASQVPYSIATIVIS